MSSSRGNSCRKRPQKHQNKTAFKNDLHDTSHKTKILNSMEITGVCKRCKDIIEWKIKYKKYKSLTAPRKCVGCEQKTIRYAYHMLCTKCASEKIVCAKCCKPVEDVAVDEEHQNADNKSTLKGLPERKRRTILRLINKDQELSPEMMSQVENILSGLDKISLDSDDDDHYTSDDLNQFESDNVESGNVETRKM